MVSTKTIILSLMFIGVQVVPWMEAGIKYSEFDCIFAVAKSKGWPLVRYTPGTQVQTYVIWLGDNTRLLCSYFVDGPSKGTYACHKLRVNWKDYRMPSSLLVPIYDNPKGVYKKLETVYKAQQKIHN